MQHLGHFFPLTMTHPLYFMFPLPSVVVADALDGAGEFAREVGAEPGALALAKSASLIRLCTLLQLLA